MFIWNRSIDAVWHLSDDAASQDYERYGFMTKRKGSAGHLVRSDGRHAALDVYELLRDSILSGRIRPGAYLLQAEVARELGVSRTPVREALRRLHESGLIVGEPNFRSRVIGFDAEEIESLYIKRIVLEGFSVLCTAYGASGAQLSDLRSGLANLQRRLDMPAADWIRARLDFHTLLAVGASPTIRKELTSWQERCFQLERSVERARTRAANTRHADVGEYKKIVDAIARAKGERAADLLVGMLGTQGMSVIHTLAPDRDLKGLKKAVHFMVADTNQTVDCAPQSPLADALTLGRIDPVLSAYLPSNSAQADPKNAVARGRPRDASKREAILAAAHSLFLEFGPDAITMNRLADEANVAKATLYLNFKDKAAVLEAWVRRESELMVSETWKIEHRDSPLIETLTDFGQHMLTFLANPQHLVLERLVFGIASRDADLGERLFVAGPGRIYELMKSILRDGQSKGELSIANLNEAADDLSGLLQGFLNVDFSFHQPPAPKAAYLRERATRAINQFMRLYGSNTNRKK